MLFNYKRSFFARFFMLITGIFILAYVVVVFTWQLSMKESIYYSSGSHLLYVAKNSNEKFEDTINELFNEITNMASSEEVEGFFLNTSASDDGSYSHLTSFLKSCHDTNEATIRGISLISTDGRTLSVGLPYLPNDYMNQPWFEKIAGYHERPQIIMRDFYGKSNSYYITLGYTVFKNASAIGTIILDTKPEIFIRAFGQSSFDGSVRSMVVDSNKNILFCNAIYLDEKELPEIADYISKADYNNKISEFTINKKSYIFTVQYSTYTGWKNVTFLPESAIDKEYKNSIKSTFIYVFAVLILVTAVAALISLKLSNKTLNLVKKIESIDLNKLEDTNIDFEYDSYDEIGIISNKFSNMLKTIKNQLIEIKAFDEKKRLDDIKALKSQITPHFLYNTLNAIDNMAAIHGNVKICNITKSLINLLRYSLNDSNDIVTIEAELEYVKNYLEIMQTKFLREIYITYDVDPSILKCKILKMVLQPIAENCIKHALVGKEGEYIHFKISKSDDSIEIKVIDNGKGIEPEVLENVLCNLDNNPEHLGLSNVDMRIKLTFGNEYGLDISSIPGMQTIVKVILPYIEED